MTTLLRVLACTTVALAPLEGYLFQVHPQLAKVSPALLAIAWVVVRVRQRKVPTPHVVHAALALFTVLLLASAAMHADGPFTVEYTLRWLPFLVLTMVLIDVAVREVSTHALLRAAFGGAAVAAVGALYSLIAGGEARATGPLEDPNDLAYFLVVALPLLIALPPERRRIGRGAQLAMVLAATVVAAGAAATFSRGGAIALTCAIAWLVARRALPLPALGGALAMLAVLGLTSVLIAGPELARALQEKSYIAGSNVDTRELRWQAAARMLAENPVLGVGPGGFRSEYAASSRNAEIAEQTPVAHDIYLEVAAELGLPAFVLFLGLLAIAIVASERVLRASTDRRPMVAVQASLIAAAVAATFLSEQYYLPIWLLIAVAVAADLRVRRRRVNDSACATRDQ